MAFNSKGPQNSLASRIIKSVLGLSVFAIISMLPVISHAKKDGPNAKELAYQRSLNELQKAPRVALEDELTWFGFRLFDPTTDEGAKLPSGLVISKREIGGIWDFVQIEAADGKIVGLQFYKQAKSAEEAIAFWKALHETVTEKLKIRHSYNSTYGTTSWSLSTEEKFLSRWQNRTMCAIAVARSGMDPLPVCGTEPEKTAITKHLESVSIRESEKGYFFVFSISTYEKSEFVAETRNQLKTDLKKQLNSM